MGFWSKLGKGLLAGVGAIAAPLTGGASLATVLPAVLSGAGAVASGMAGAKAENRGAQDAYNLQRDQLAMQAERDFLNRQNDAYRNAIGSGYVQNWAPMSPREGIRDVYKGRTLSDGSRRAAELMERRALRELSEGRPYNPAKASKAGFWENLLGPVGLGLSTVGAIGDTLQTRYTEGGREPSSGMSDLFTPDLGGPALIDPATYGQPMNPSIWRNIRF